MKTIILFLEIFFSISSWSSEKIIIVSSLDSINVIEYFVNKDQTTLLKRHKPYGYLFLKESTLVLYSWNKELKYYEVLIDKLGDWEYVFKASSLGTGAIINLERYITVGENDPEVDCYNNKSNFFLVDLHKKDHTLISTDEYPLKSLLRKIKRGKISYYDTYPRGAGINKYSTLINVLNLDTWKVQTIKEFSGLSDTYKIGIEYPLFGVGQWISPETIAYMTMEITDIETESNNILRLYICNLKSSPETTLLASFVFPYSIEDVDFQIFDGNIYLKNVDGIYMLNNNVVNEIYKSKDGNILGFWIKN